MKFVCSKSSLSSALQIVSKAVPSKTTMSILECVMIDATEDFIRFIANDMEMGIQTDIEGDIIENGYVAIDAKIFFEIIRKLPIRSSSKITVVKPGWAMPMIFCTREITPNTTATMSVTTPITVTMCSGTEEKEVMLVMAYLISDLVDHLLSPSVRSCTR